MDPSNSRAFPAAFSKILWILVWLLAASPKASAQAIDSTTTFTLEVMDSVTMKVTPYQLQLLAEAASEATRIKYHEREVHARQEEAIARLKKKYYEILDYFNQGIDTSRMRSDLEDLRIDQENAIRDILSDTTGIRSNRNLTVTGQILDEQLKHLDALKAEVSRRISDLTGMRRDLDSLTLDSVIYQFPNDTALMKEYWGWVRELNKLSKPTEDKLDLMIRSVRAIDTRLDRFRSRVTDHQHLVDSTQVRNILLGANADGPLWNLPPAPPGSPGVFTLSSQKQTMSLRAYMQLHGMKFFLFLLLFLFIGVNLRRFRNYIRQSLPEEDLLEYRSVIGSPMLTSAFIVLMTGQFFFGKAPFLLSAILWALSAVLLLLILWRRWNVRDRVLYPIFMSSFLLAILLQLALRPSATEGMLLALLAVGSVLLGMGYLRRPHAEIPQYRAFRWIILGSMAFAVLGLLAIWSGRYNTARMLVITAIFAPALAVLLYWTNALIGRILGVAAAHYTQAGRAEFARRFEDLRHVLPGILYPVFWICWAILLSRNFFIQRYIAAGISDFFTRTRTVGDYTFSLDAALIFIAVIFISVLIAKVIAFFTGEQASGKGGRVRGGIGNWLLLIRIAIVGAGVVVAFLAAGIPIDKITLIIGSLGIGIGLGLQNIVNNLFSGILLAFERPFQIGDQIEVGGIFGKVKEIGIRSSKLSTPDGSDVLIPNGDLLSQHLVNWTLSNHHRRTEIIMGVAYGSHLQLVKEAIEALLTETPGILSRPAPVVLLHNFNASSVDFRILYWTEIDQLLSVKSEFCLQMEKRFNELGIEIPFPQMDVRIRQDEEAGDSAS